MAAFLLGSELILVVDARGARFDHRPHELISLERSTEAGFRVGEDRQLPVDVRALDGLDLPGAQERVVQAPHERRRTVCRIEALVRVRLTGQVRVGGNLPARDIDRLQTGLGHLDGLAACHGAERRDVLVAFQ